MLWTIIIVLLVLWALGFGFAGSAIGGLIHLLLVLALVLLVVQLLTGRRGAI
ncbi:MAG: lmo0937 family membrane protein [Pyrinomonadaceae bacterium]